MNACNTNPSFENPTWGYLFSNFTKLELQKRCRKYGLTKIWVTKDKLVDVITNAQQSVSDPRVEDTLDPLQITQLELQELRERVAKKDFEIEELK